MSRTDFRRKAIGRRMVVGFRERIARRNPLYHNRSPEKFAARKLAYAIAYMPLLSFDSVNHTMPARGCQLSL